MHTSCWVFSFALDAVINIEYTYLFLIIRVTIRNLVVNNRDGNGSNETSSKTGSVAIVPIIFGTERQERVVSRRNTVAVAVRAEISKKITILLTHGLLCLRICKKNAVKNISNTVTNTILRRPSDLNKRILLPNSIKTQMAWRHTVVYD